MKRVWVVGSSNILKDYIDVLKLFEYEIIIVTRDIGKISNKFNDIKKYQINYGEKFGFNLKNDYVIIATSILSLYGVCKYFIENGAKNILVEKPLTFKLNEIVKIRNLAIKNQVKIVVGYNRRFYDSTKHLKFILTNQKKFSIRMNISERLQEIFSHGFAKEIIDNWMLANTSHMIDLFLFIFGQPGNFTVNNSGYSKIGKYPGLYRITGTMELGNPFQISGDWTTGGSWSIEVRSEKDHYKLEPLEILKKSNLKNESWDSLMTSDNNDQYKPGFFNMITSFLKINHTDFCTLDQLIVNFRFIQSITKKD